MISIPKSRLLATPSSLPWLGFSPVCEWPQYIEEITEGADKQLKIQVGLAEIMEKWAAELFVFNEWKGRGINVLKGTGTIVEELEEAQVCSSLMFFGTLLDTDEVTCEYSASPLRCILCLFLVISSHGVVLIFAVISLSSTAPVNGELERALGTMFFISCFRAIEGVASCRYTTIDAFDGHAKGIFFYSTRGLRPPPPPLNDWYCTRR